MALTPAVVAPPPLPAVIRWHGVGSPLNTYGMLGMQDVPRVIGGKPENGGTFQAGNLAAYQPQTTLKGAGYPPDKSPNLLMIDWEGIPRDSDWRIGAKWLAKTATAIRVAWKGVRVGYYGDYEDMLNKAFPSSEIDYFMPSATIHGSLRTFAFQKPLAMAWAKWKRPNIAALLAREGFDRVIPLVHPHETTDDATMYSLESLATMGFKRVALWSYDKEKLHQDQAVHDLNGAEAYWMSLVGAETRNL